MMGPVAAALAVGLALVSEGEAPGGHFPLWVGELQTEVIKTSKAYDGEIMLYVKDLKTGTRYTYNGATPAYLASGVKLAFLIELFRQAQEGKLSLDEQVIYTEEDVRDGSPLFNFVKPGSPVSLRVLAEAMIQQSDNAASDMIVRRVGIDNVNAGLAKLGFTGFGPITSLLDVRRLAYSAMDVRIEKLKPSEVRALGFAKGGEARAMKLAQLLGELPGTYTSADMDAAFDRYYASGHNSASMESAGALLEALALGKVVSATASKTMVDIMLGTQTGGRRLPARLPAGTPIAHKTGTQYRRLCDLAIMYMPDARPVVCAVCVKTGKSQGKGEDVMARIGKKIYDLLAPAATAALAAPVPDDEWEEIATSSVAEERPPSAPPPAAKKAKKKGKKKPEAPQ